jgi:hypothetical protein
MTTFGDMVYQFGGVPVGGFDPVMLAGGKWYFADPTHGAAGGDAQTPATATNSVKTAYDLCRDGYNDGVVFIGGATAWNPTAALTWSKSYTHLIGTNNLPGVGNRCRVVAKAADTLSPVITFSGSGCLIKNLQVYNEKATGTANGTIVVTGSRNMLENVFALTPVSVTAASYSLKVAGSENVFIRCSIGQHTNARSAASYGLWLYNGTVGTCLRNKFIKSEFLSWSSSVAHELCHIDADLVGETWTVQFEDCLWDNVVAGAGTLTAAIVDASTAADHTILFRGKNEFCGITAVANPLTYTRSVYRLRAFIFTRLSNLTRRKPKSYLRLAWQASTLNPKSPQRNPSNQSWAGESLPMQGITLCRCLLMASCKLLLQSPKRFKP